ncbi:MAG TPA: orotidine-5'-phosphate decarboxylase [Thermodesulfobacteriaceae bacterium]|nr:orotidine-5'-phosphate decarboxylase [Thermodesulfobacteriaceae bacterium]
MSDRKIPLNERIIFALDVDSPDTAKKWVEMLERYIGFYKVGLQLFLAGGFPVVDWIIGRGHKVMVDLKFFDVPETVKLAVRQLNNRGITLATVHGNDSIIRAAVEARDGVAILAVTVLTSFGEEDMREMGMTRPVEDLVHYRSRRAVELGCDGIVCSALEAARLRTDLGSDFLIVTPGIRPAVKGEIGRDDQKRVATAKQAVLNGADYVVVGRPVSRAEDPVAVVQALQAEIKEAVKVSAPFGVTS